LPGRVVAFAGVRFMVAVEHSKPGIDFGDRIEVLRDGLAPVRVGALAGLALRREGTTGSRGAATASRRRASRGPSKATTRARRRESRR